MAVAAEIGVSPVALSKWRQGGPLSLENACKLAVHLNVSLDWLVLGREAAETGLTDEAEAVVNEVGRLLRARPNRISSMVADLVSEIPPRNAAKTNVKQ